jgi:hypothetical protein
LSLTSRRKRPLDRERHPLRDARLVVIATEGQETEPQYFRAFEKADSRTQVVVLETQRGESAPKHVLRRLDEFKKGFELGKGDLLFLVIDEDRWPAAQLSEVASEARRKTFALAVSSPCFDVWLYMHHADPPATMQTMCCREVKAELRSVLGEYNPSNLRMERFIPRVEDAIRRAISLNSDHTARWPARPGSRVYLIMQTIQA